MNTNCVTKVFTAIVLLLVWLSVSACSQFIKPEVGSIALEDARFALVDGSIQDALLDTKDFRLQYSLTTTADAFTISGKLSMDRSILDSFGLARKFILKLNFLDTEGRVLGTSDITPLVSFNGQVADVIEVKKSGTFPIASTSIAFNFFGTFRAITSEYGRDEWDVFYFPFE